MISLIRQEKTYKILFLGRLLIGFIFAYSGFTKLVEPAENFQAGIAAYEIIPYVFISLLARVVPWIEFVFGAFLIVGYLPRVSALVLAGMSWSFVVLIVLTRLLTGSLPADCGCFGEGSIVHFSAAEIFIADFCNTVIGLRLALIKEHPFSLASWLQKKS